MLRRLSVFQVIVMAVLVAGTVPVVIVAVQASGAIPLLTGLIVLVPLAVVASYWLRGQIVAPAVELSKIAAEIKGSVDAETVDSMKPSLQRLESIQAAQEFAHLASAFEDMVLVFQQRMAEFNSIYAMGQAITSKVDFEQTVQAVLEAVKQVVDFDAAEVTVLRDDKLVVEAWSGKEEYSNTMGREYHVGRGPTGMIAANKESVLVSTLSGTEEDLRRTLGYESVVGEFLTKTHKVEINSFLGIPLLIGDRLIGTLTLVHRDPGRFTEGDRRQLNKLAAQASIAIDNAIQVRQRENVLKAQIRELRVEVDAAHINQQVEEITASDYFQHLQAHAAKMRDRVYTRDARRRAGQADSGPAPSEAGSDVTP
jgi:GAF domain-containing protein